MARPSTKKHASQQSLNGAVKSICDIIRRSNCAGALQYVPELTWILFLRILDEREVREADPGELLAVIEDRGREVEGALANLKRLLTAEPSPAEPLAVGFEQAPLTVSAPAGALHEGR